MNIPQIIVSFVCFRSSFSDFSSKFGKDPRFKMVEKSKDRESMFSDHVSDLKKKEREQKAAHKEKVRIVVVFLYLIIN